eukprot:GILJ01000679.1.p1 GENE.GILJ01000679.1~~GILJ01000679.1.p1  ORF type:complete len:224 (+),score=23.22 GILJ01000679.1:92-673(+)
MDDPAFLNYIQANMHDAPFLALQLAARRNEAPDFITSIVNMDKNKQTFKTEEDLYYAFADCFKHRHCKTCTREKMAGCMWCPLKGASKSHSDKRIGPHSRGLCINRMMTDCAQMVALLDPPASSSKSRGSESKGVLLGKNYKIEGKDGYRLTVDAMAKYIDPTFADPENFRSWYHRLDRECDGKKGIEDQDKC